MEIVTPTMELIVNDMINNKANFAAIYARESNKNAKSALDTQINTCENYARGKDFIIYDIYSEFRSASRESFNSRTEFKKLIEDAKKGLFKKVIVTKRDRLARRFEEYVEIRNFFKELDIEIFYSNDIQIKENDGYAVKFIENLIMAVAELEPQTIKDRTLNGLKEQRETKKYNKHPPYGVLRPSKEKYVADGIRADIVKDIFKTFIKNKDIKYANEVLEKLRESYKSKTKEHKDLLEEINSTKIKRIIGTPSYAQLQTKEIGYYYSNFSINHEGGILKVTPEYFQKCDNIPALIKPSDWYKAVEKWNRYNEKKHSKSSSPKTVEQFNGIFYCKDCNKAVTLKDKSFSCGTRKCVSIKKERFLQVVISQLISSLTSDNGMNNAIKEIVSKLKKEKTNLKKALEECILNQGDFVNKYILDISNSEIKHKISETVKRKKELEYSIMEVERKIDFLNKDFSSIIVPITQSKHMGFIIDELEKNQYAILELFLHKSIEEVIINGHRVGVRETKPKLSI